MFGIALHHNPAELYRFLIDRIKESPEKKLVLVRSQATRRFLTRQLQKELNFLAPRIETLESWLDDLASLCFEHSERPGLILNPDERVLVLEDWLRNHAREAYRKFAGAQSVQAISNIIADLHRADMPLDRLSGVIDPESFHGTPHFAELLKDYRLFLTEQKLIDREQLPGLLKHIDASLIPQDELILYEQNYLFAGQKKGLKVVMDFCTDVEKTFTLIQFKPKYADREDLTADLVDWCKMSGRDPEFFGLNEEKEEQVYSLLASCSPNLVLHTQVWHDPRTELDQVMRSICQQIDQAEPGDHGSRCEHYVILAGDISHYESLAEPLSRRYQLPVYCTRGPSLISHPVVRRLLKLLRLRQDGFQMDDMYQIFADNQIRMPKLDYDADSTPNVRSFSQFCRRYNLRTLGEVRGQLESIFEAQKSQINSRASTDGTFDINRALEKLEANHRFYNDITDHLSVFEKTYAADDICPLHKWISQAINLLSIPENLFSSQANLIRSKMLETLREIEATHDKLGLSPELSYDDFYDILELYLTREREKPEEQPEGILLTQAGYFSDTFGKTVFLLGMNENGFPAGENLDYLQFRYEDSLPGMLYQARPDRYLEARLELSRQLAGARQLYLSRPEHIGQQKIIGSSLWQDLLLEMEKHGTGRFTWPADPDNVLLSRQDVKKALAQKITVKTSALFTKPVPEHSELISAITNERADPGTMGCYDGMLDGSEAPEWKPFYSRQHQAWWNRNFPDNLIHTSITHLDEYASSPLDYFFKRVLRLNPPELYRDDAESDVKGTLLHEILEAFYTSGTPYATTFRELVWPVDDMDLARRRMNEIRQSLLTEYGNQLGYKESPFPAILTGNIKKITDWFLLYETKLHDHLVKETHPIRPAPLHRHPDFSMEYHWTLNKDYGDIQVRIAGKIDRIDIDEKAGTAVVYDYKSGSGGVKKFHQHVNLGESFQLPVYAMAIFDKGVERFAGGYYRLPLSRSRKDVCVHYVMGDETLFSDSFYSRKQPSTLMGIAQKKELHDFLGKIENERLLWILRNLKKGTFNLTLNKQPAYSDFKWISRYNNNVQKERKTIEDLQRMETPRPDQLYRYYAPLEIIPEC
ncbi:MAG: PD-(D/E)XK nuclease family protein [Balneolales bacterium]